MDNVYECGQEPQWYREYVYNEDTVMLRFGAQNFYKLTKQADWFKEWLDKNHEGKAENALAALEKKADDEFKQLHAEEDDEDEVQGRCALKSYSVEPPLPLVKCTVSTSNGDKNTHFTVHYHPKGDTVTVATGGNQRLILGTARMLEHGRDGPCAIDNKAEKVGKQRQPIAASNDRDIKEKTEYDLLGYRWMIRTVDGKTSYHRDLGDDARGVPSWTINNVPDWFRAKVKDKDPEMQHCRDFYSQEPMPKWYEPESMALDDDDSSDEEDTSNQDDPEDD